VKENLLADGPDKITAAIDTANASVLVLRRLLRIVHSDVML
jgi:hypothetical protein